MSAWLDPEAVIARIYDAVSAPDRWKDALEAVQRSLGADAMLLLYCDLAAGKPHVVEATGFDRKSLDVYTAEHLCNEELIRESINGPAGIVVSSSRHYRGKRFSTTDIFRQLLRPSDLLHIAGAAALNTSRVYASLWMARSDREQDFSVHDLHLFSELLPHFGRVMAVHHRVRRAEIQADMAVGAFDRVAVGVVLLDVRGAPVMVNREARRIADQKDGFSLLADRLVASGAGQTKELRDLVHRVSWVGPVGERVGGGALRLGRPSGKPDYHVVVLPLPRRCQPAAGNGAVEVLFITDTEKSQGPVDYLFGDLYGLTEAEVRLVSQLLLGGGLTGAAEQLGLSRNTVHSQLASVFQKTGTRRQSELLRLLLAGVAPVEPPDFDSGIDEPGLKPRQLRD